VSERPTIGVAVTGSGRMGCVHAQACARVPHHFPDLPVTVVPVAVADDVPGGAQVAVRQFGFERAGVDRHDVIADPRVAPVGVAAVAAGAQGVVNCNHRHAPAVAAAGN
jgi:predicted dehydrogenase